MLDAFHPERNSMPTGMCCFQNSNRRPNTCTSAPAARKCAAAERP